MEAQDTVCVISILVSKKKKKTTMASCYLGRTACRLRTEVCLMGARGRALREALFPVPSARDRWRNEGPC